MLCVAPDLSDVHGVVLAGSYPRGLSTFDRLKPRALMPVAQSPLAVYPLRWLSEAGIRNVTLCANGSTPALRKCLADETDLPSEVSFYEDRMPRGTAGCVRDVGLGTGSATLLVVDGTTIPCVDVADLLATHQASGAAVTVVAHSDGGPASSDRALNPGGIYVFDRRAIDFVNAYGFQDIKETLIPRLHAAGEDVRVHVIAPACPSVVDVDTYLAVNRWMISRLVAEGRIPRGYRAREGTLVHSSARVAGDARLLGPVMLGPDVVVEEGATVVGPTAIGRGSRVGPGAVVCRSVAWDDCWFGPDSMVDRSLLADQAVVRPGASFYNMLKRGQRPRAPFFPGPAVSPSLRTKPVPATEHHW